MVLMRNRLPSRSYTLQRIFGRDTLALHPSKLNVFKELQRCSVADHQSALAQSTATKWKQKKKEENKEEEEKEVEIEKEEEEEKEEEQRQIQIFHKSQMIPLIFSHQVRYHQDQKDVTDQIRAHQQESRCRRRHHRTLVEENVRVAR